MDVLTTDNKKIELLNAIKNSMEDGQSVLTELNEFFMDCISRLRVQETQEILQDITDAIHNLQYFVEFAGELNNAISCFDNLSLPGDPMLSNNAGLHLFKELLSSLENEDWVMLSDLVEYELSPLLLKEKEWLIMFQGKINNV